MKKSVFIMTLVCLMLMVSMITGAYAAGIEIQQQPSDQVAAENEKVVFSVMATGDNLSYRWQYRPAGSEQWNNAGLEGCKTKAITVPAIKGRDGQAYRCKITDGSGTEMYSDAAVLTLEDEANLEIVTQPEDFTGVLGETVSLSTVATGSGLSYQWQYRPDGSNDWANSGLEGRKTSTLQIPVTMGRNKQAYRCIVSDSLGNEIVTNEAVLTVKSNAEIKITSQPRDVSGAIGDTVSISVEATGSGLTYLWQYKPNADSDWRRSGLDTRDTSTLEIPVTKGRNGQAYRCVITDVDGNELVSDSATLTVTASSPIEITEQPKDISGVEGETVNITVKATGDSLEYQWQYQAVGKSDWKNCGLEGRKTDTLKVPATSGRDKQKYRCVITDAAGNTAISNEVQFTLTEEVVTNTVTVTFIDEDGSEIAVEEVEVGEDAPLPANPTKEGFLFAGWSGNYKNVQDDEIVQATYIAENEKNIFSVDSVDVSKGETATIYVRLSGDVEYVDFDMDLSYDQDVLEIVSTKTSRMIADVCNFGDGIITFNYSGTDNQDEEGDVVAITFKVKEDAPSSDTMITFSNVKFVDIMVDGDFVEAEYHTIPGVIHIK